MATFLGRTHYPLSFRIEVIKYYKKSKSLKATLKKFNISQRTWYRWRNDYMNGILTDTKSGKHGILNFKNNTINWKQPNFNMMNDAQMQYYIGTLHSKMSDENWTQIDKYNYISLIGKKISMLCQILNALRSSYYDWKKKGCPQMNAFKSEIVAIIEANYGLDDIKLGVKRFKHYLENEGIINLSYATVRKYLRFCNKIAYTNKRKIIKSKQLLVKNDQNKENIIKYDFKASKPNEKWFVDFTYVDVDNEWAYVGYIKDSYNNAIIESITCNGNDNQLPQIYVSS